MKANRAMQRAVTIALAASAALLAAPLAATADDAKSGNAKFLSLDRNKDGVLTKDEVREIRGAYAKAFDQADDNKDGRLDQNEFVKAEAIHERMLAGKYVDDSVITTKVKAALLREPKLKSMDVSVETYNGEVLLSGFVRDESQREAAKKVATRVAGVTSVKDAMVVRN
jgi:hyperosmotically inducible protein